MKNIKLKKSIALLLAMAMSVTVLAACGASNDAGVGGSSNEVSNIQQGGAENTDNSGNVDSGNGVTASNGVVFSPDDPVTISIWLVTNQALPSPDNKIAKLLKEELGVTLEYELTTPDNQEMRTGTLLAGGTYPDILAPSEIKAPLVTGGAMLRLNDYLDSGDYPLLKEHVDPYMNYLSYKGGEVEDGLYILPNYNRYYGEINGNEHYGPGFFIQKAVLEDAGYPDLSNMTIEKYFELIENYKNKYPAIDGVETVGFVIPCFPGRVWGITNPPALLAGSPNNGGVIVDESNVAKIYANSEYAYRWFKFLNEMYNKGLVDPESFTLTEDQYQAKLASGAVLGMHDQRWGFGNAVESLVASSRQERTWVPTMPTFDGNEPWYADRDVMNKQQGMGISTSCQQVEVVLGFLELMLSEKWQKILFWGIEGEDYLVDEDGLFYRTEEMRREQEDLVWMSNNRLMAFRDQLVKHQGTHSDGNPFDANGSVKEFTDTLVEYDKNFLEAYGKSTWKGFINQPPENPPYYPAWNIELSEEAEIANRQMEDLAMQYLPRAILESMENFDKVWDEYLTQLDRVNIQAYEDDINKGIQERLK
ncbi:extracellular solute-binding protein [Kineothrix sp. MB12-C1]|uniref:extracellular solute-binding protein n=1 Tax=Kineothrix sp. MB12-C1 TaxID=3070215 RepID=UPI0027D31122|nr:extracellular solute-binding protein [Kineothrix sp. MB12-C1]WMC93323.1 extracellular solute-binding protein [Kineothrix sp. MB12-C1]